VATLFQRFWGAFRKTREQVGEQWRRLVGLRPGPEFWEGLEETLYRADLGPATVDAVMTGLKQRMAQDRPVEWDDLRRYLADELLKLLPPDPTDPWDLSVYGLDATNRPVVWMVVGVNGTGKTTSVAKLAYGLKRQGYSVLLGAADTFRAAATEQLQVWGERLGVEVIHQKPGADPAAVAYDAVQAGRHRGVDAVLIDTAGRLHTKAPLMQELGKIVRVVGRDLPGAPHAVWLVLDATTGQNGIQQARVFQEAAPATGIILTKLDGTAKGGVVFQIQQDLGVPVRWVGLGEQLDDLQPFDREAFVNSVVGEEETR
jgi:fused signal recognition particle receptor